MQRRVPRLVLAGTNSGCGKTTVTCAVLQALVSRCVECRVVEQHNAAGLHLGGDSLVDGVGVVVLPVEGIHIPLDRLHPQ